MSVVFMSILVGLLAIFSAAAAAGMRVALPLLLIGLLQSNLWEEVPLLSRVHPQVLVAILTSWSLFELLASKRLLGQRVLQLIQLLFTPFVGAVMAVTMVRWLKIEGFSLWLTGGLGGLFALVLKLVQVGWFFRLRGLPLWSVFLEDFLCVVLVLFAFKAPKNGGIIAMLLFWLALRSSTAWRRWYLGKERAGAE